MLSELGVEPAHDDKYTPLPPPPRPTRVPDRPSPPPTARGNRDDGRRVSVSQYTNQNTFLREIRSWSAAGRTENARVEQAEGNPHEALMEDIRRQRRLALVNRSFEYYGRRSRRRSADEAARIAEQTPSRDTILYQIRTARVGLNRVPTGARGPRGDYSDGGLRAAGGGSLLDAIRRGAALNRAGSGTGSGEIYPPFFAGR